jgi:predicted amidohydrolase
VEDLRLVEVCPVVQLDLGHGVDPDPVILAERVGADRLAPARVADDRGQELELRDRGVRVAGPDAGLLGADQVRGGLVERQLALGAVFLAVAVDEHGLAVVVAGQAVVGQLAGLHMTSNRNLKRRVRSRAAKTGESYAAARRHIHSAQWGDAAMPGLPLLKLATAQVVVRDDPRDAGQLRQCGRDARELMRQAGSAGARIIHFPEGATCSPSNRILSVTGPAEVGPADWDRADWRVLRQELAAIARLAGELRLWTVLGSVHRLTPPHRPHNSMYVISDHGELVTRYDERLLSNTKLSFMYAPGSGPVTFDVDGLRFGCAMGIEVHYPEVFGQPALAIADIDNRPESIDLALAKARPWRRLARTGVYDSHQVTDDRSDNRAAF